MALRLSIFLLLLHWVESQKTEGDTCVDEYTNSVGRCAKAETCQSAKTDLEQNGIRPTFCAYTFEGALVCCRDGGTILQTPPPKHHDDDDARPVWSNNPAQQNDTRRISERKCEQYSRGVVQRVEFTPLLTDNEPQKSISTSKCDYTGVELIVGGEKASLGEFPHMAAIGWSTFDGYDFSCGGSLISHRHVLTAGHCALDPRRQTPEPVVVRLGDQNINPKVDDGARPVEVPIKNIIRHPDYQPPKKYHDIAILELATEVDFEANIRPACLWPWSDFQSYKKVIAIGWGATDPHSKVSSSEELLKVSLSLLDNDYCDPLLAEIRNRNWNGFIPQQMCAGELRGGKDTCQGDSGSPLQVASADNQCIFRIVGIVSFGRVCAQSGQPAVYTRVSAYVDWIEGVVWSGE